MKKFRHVYYDKFTGQILEILKQKKRGLAYNIKCDIEDVLPILTGERSINEFIVAYDINKKEHTLLEKDNVIKLRKLGGNKLYKIPYKKQGEYDLKITSYTGSNIIEVTLDFSRLSRLCNTNFQDKVMFEKGTEIRLYLKEKGTEKLLKTIVIDAQQLLDQVQIFYNVDDIDLNNVNFYTERLFEKYIWNKGTVRFFSPAKNQVKFNINKADTIKQRDDFKYHLIITEVDDGLKIENFIEDPKLVKINSDIEFFIVDKYDNNILYNKFGLSLDNLKNKIIPVGLKKTYPTKQAILYNHKYISVLFKGKNND